VDKQCVASFEANFPEADVLCEDIVGWPKPTCGSGSGSSNGDCAAGGRPTMPPFSKSRFWRTDLPKGFADPRRRSFHAVLTAIRVARPLAFLVENVRADLPRAPRRARLLVKEAEALGYSLAGRW